MQRAKISELIPLTLTQAVIDAAEHVQKAAMVVSATEGNRPATVFPEQAKTLETPAEVFTLATFIIASGVSEQVDLGPAALDLYHHYERQYFERNGRKTYVTAYAPTLCEGMVCNALMLLEKGFADSAEALAGHAAHHSSKGSVQEVVAANVWEACIEKIAETNGKGAFYLALGMQKDIEVVTPGKKGSVLHQKSEEVKMSLARRIFAQRARAMACRC
ncbi:MAG: hypothetical protein PHE27_09250 [Alphaproteobacteria bacterium]|nr:hypothetical protein [Alphaproteobacteria bacterium]